MKRRPSTVTNLSCSTQAKFSTPAQHRKEQLRSVRKKYTNKAKTKFCWEFVVNIPSNKYDAKGNLIRKQKAVSGFSKKEEAKKAEFEFLKQLDEGKVNLNDSSLFSEIAEKFLNYIEKSPDYAKGTVCNYKGYYNNHLQMLHNMKAKNINEDNLNKWVEDRISNNISSAVINGCRKFGMAVFTYHKKTFKFNPFKEIERRTEYKKLRNRLTVNDLKKMIEICEEKLPEFYCIFSIACLTGMRLGEYSALCREDIKPNNKIFVEKQYTRRELKKRTKTIGSTRIVNYPEELNPILQWHIRKYQIFSGFLFKGKDKTRPISPNWINDRFDNLLTLCGYNKNYMRIHDLRGEYVDIMNKAGVPIPFISRQLGHARTSTTNDIYTSILNEVKNDAMEKLGNMIFK